ncbi:hypothetical protein CHARACLAT_030515 [Characodon lateralis]|uniref:Uncharacterized protein n=1 Tax=Characodon lateralis TaxID=208331 RepID=A0ABU7CUW7_9TELE|nr:hypothetical protein [Characodon lateralis]
MLCRKNSSLGTQSCSCKLSPELTYNIRMDSLAAEMEWQDMRIIRHLEANRRTVETSAMTTSTKTTPTKTKQARMFFQRSRQVHAHLTSQILKAERNISFVSPVQDFPGIPHSETSILKV